MKIDFCFRCSDDGLWAHLSDFFLTIHFTCWKKRNTEIPFMNLVILYIVHLQKYWSVFLRPTTSVFIHNFIQKQILTILSRGRFPQWSIAGGCNTVWLIWSLLYTSFTDRCLLLIWLIDSIQSSLFYIAHYYEFVSEGCVYNLYTQTTSLSKDLTSDQEKLPRIRKKPFTRKKGKKPSGEQQRRIPLPGWTEAIIYI